MNSLTLNSHNSTTLFGRYDGDTFDKRKFNINNIIVNRPNSHHAKIKLIINLNAIKLSDMTLICLKVV